MQIPLIWRANRQRRGFSRLMDKLESRDILIVND